MIKNVIFTLCILFFASCSTLQLPQSLDYEVFCSRKMGEDYREFRIKLRALGSNSLNESLLVQGEVISLWRNNPVAGQFVDKVVGTVNQMSKGQLFRLKSQNRGAYFHHLDAWTGRHYLIRSRFNRKGSSYRTLRCKKLI